MISAELDSDQNDFAKASIPTPVARHPFLRKSGGLNKNDLREGSPKKDRVVTVRKDQKHVRNSHFSHKNGRVDRTHVR